MHNRGDERTLSIQSIIAHFFLNLNFPFYPPLPNFSFNIGDVYGQVLERKRKERLLLLCNPLFIHLFIHSTTKSQNAMIIALQSGRRYE